MAGKIYGVGVGPGDPELLTLKAVRAIRACQVIGIPAADRDTCTAYQVAKGAVPEIEEKQVAAVRVPMTKDPARLDEAYSEGSRMLAKLLEEGKDIAFLNLGDPTVYGTYMELHERLVKAGYEAELVSGVPSFCAVAAQLGVAIGSGRESIHILPGCYGTQEAADYEGTKILMKSGGRIGDVKRGLVELEDAGRIKAWAVSNCGMEDQVICRDIRELDEGAGYFTTILVKDREKGPHPSEKARNGTICE